MLCISIARAVRFLLLTLPDTREMEWRANYPPAPPFSQLKFDHTTYFTSHFDNICSFMCHWQVDQNPPCQWRRRQYAVNGQSKVGHMIKSASPLKQTEYPLDTHHVCQHDLNSHTSWSARQLKVTLTCWAHHQHLFPIRNCASNWGLLFSFHCPPT